MSWKNGANIQGILETNRAWKLKKMISKFLLRQHITLTSSTGSYLSELLIHRRIKTYLYRLQPDLAQDYWEKQETFLSNKLGKGSYRFYTIIILFYLAKQYAIQFKIKMQTWHICCNILFTLTSIKCLCLNFTSNY